ncbi:prepilin peptidase [Crossiella sp. CA-258035]|uniref:prepilin peptidase n=1 Tax=Crossiella sp. CA-258035 TaxID=2981138 RepID=UPI0024BC6E25|nr:prepilin peptidase [Crossiella sp. CA-258035]WHT20219.1 prepilin peptidase [Crossiella sp. CA-258035]
MSAAVVCGLFGMTTGPVLVVCLLRLGAKLDPRLVQHRGVVMMLAGLVLLACLGARRAGDPALPAWCLLVALGLVLAAIDWECRRLPHPLTAVLGLGGLILLAAASAWLGEFGGLWRGVAAAAVVGVVTVALHVVQPAGFGGGDAVLLPVLSLFLGYLGWEHLSRGLGLSILLTGVVAVGLLVAGRARWGQGAGFPAGPPLIAGTLLVVIFH